MTAVGKILVFFNLIFSVAIGAFAILDYTARTHWHEGYKKLEARVQAAEGAGATYRAEADRLSKDREQLNVKFKDMAGKDAEMKGTPGEDPADKVVKALASALQQVRDQKTEIDRLGGLVANERKKAVQQETSATVAQDDVKRRQNDVDKLRATLKDETERNYLLTKEKNQLRDDKVAAEIQAKTLKDINIGLEAQMRQLVTDMKNMKRPAGAVATGTGSTNPQNNPPPENVEGLVKRADPASGLVTITLGSDASLAKGHTMDVFRLGAAPRYLGKIRILEVSANQSVAQVLNKSAAPIQVGDKVTSSILGNK